MWIHSESQTGKDAADRDTAKGKQRAYNYIDRGNDINTPEDLFNAINEGGPPLKGISLYYCNNENSLTSTYKIENLNSLSAFTSIELRMKDKHEMLFECLNNIKLVEEN